MRIVLTPENTKLLHGIDLHEEVILEGVLEAKRTVWIATANLKDMHVSIGRGYQPILDRFDLMAAQGVRFRVIHCEIPSRPFRDTFENCGNLVSGGTSNRQVFRKELMMPSTFYFAEGYTGAGFQEYLCLGNPDDTATFAIITYLFPDGTIQEQEVALAANSRATVNVNGFVGADKQVSATVDCDLAIVAVGSGANPLLTGSTEGLALNKWGYIVIDEQSGKTSRPGVWAGGDIVTGAATVILAMGAGRIAANSIHKYLMLGW